MFNSKKPHLVTYGMDGNTFIQDGVEYRGDGSVVKNDIVEKPVETVAEKPVEAVVEKPVEKPVDAPMTQSERMKLFWKNKKAAL